MEVWKVQVIFFMVPAVIVSAVGWYSWTSAKKYNRKMKKRLDITKSGI